MSIQNEARNRIREASAACEKALDQWHKAIDALDKDVGVNGLGVIRDRYAFRRQLMEAQASIAASFAALDAVKDWPSDADYDCV